MGFDTLVLTKRVPESINVETRGAWEGIVRRHPLSFLRQMWAFHDRSADGWKVWWQPDDHVLEIRLSVPVVMDRSSITNYPLKQLEVESLARVAWSISRALGLKASDSTSPDWWSDFGVRSAAVTMDLDVVDPAGVVGVLHGLRHAGVWAGYRTTCRWKSGTREVQVYAKGPELRKKLSKEDYGNLERRFGSLDRVLRLEVTLGAADIKGVLGLKDTVWLPKIEAMNRREVLSWILFDEVYNKLKIRRVFRRESSASDRALALADDLVAEARQQGEQPNMAVVTKLVGASLLFGGVGSSRELCDRYGFARATANSVRRELVTRGFPPGVAVEPNNHRLIGSVVRGVRDLLGNKAPKKPVIPEHDRERLTITAPWVLEHDATRTSPGMSIDDHSLDDLLEWAGLL